MKSVQIYYDPILINYHKPSHGSLECNKRIDLSVEKFCDQSYNVQSVKPRDKYMRIALDLHKSNPVLAHLAQIPKPNFFHRLFGLKPFGLKWTCYQCTMLSNTTHCDMCKAKYDNKKFIAYAHTLDKNIVDSDTTYITFDTIDSIAVSVSNVCVMIENIRSKSIKNGFAIVRPPGHHASCAKSEGFCIVNNIAVGAIHALKIGFKKIFIFDFDAHHGNGTQEIFYARSDVYYCSMHTMEFYPKTGLESEKGELNGLGFNLNIIVPKKVTTAEYLDKFGEKVLSAIATYNPDLILVSAGFDGLSTDPMAMMSLTLECYVEMVSQLKTFGIPIGMVLEGGYDLENLSGCINGCIKELGK
jgi:acetoin utilization deacetylase AcuC-like enzyme